MIWLTWRQFRVQALIAAAALAAAAILLGVTGPRLASRYAARFSSVLLPWPGSASGGSISGGPTCKTTGRDPGQGISNTQPGERMEGVA